MTALLDLVREGWDGLMAHRARSFLSALGIVFGVAAVIGILSIGEGARREQETLIAQLGILNFQVRNRDLTADPVGEKEIRRVSVGLTTRDAAVLAAELPDAVHVGSARKIDLPEIVPKPRDVTKITLFGADPAWLAGTNLTLVRGRPLNPSDERNRAQVCLIGDLARRQLFGAGPALGRQIRLGDTWLTVVGLIDDGGRGGTLEGVDVESRAGAIFVPLATMLARIAPEGGKPELSEIQVSVAEPGQVEGHAALTRRILHRLHRQQADTELTVPLRLLEQSRAQQRLFNLVMGLIAGISLLVGGIGIMNIMLASVLERTREIGVRLAVGARPRDIAALFLVESSLISLMGGVFGVLAGLMLSFLVAAATGWSTAVSPQAVLLATLISTAEGVLFGYIPARRAAGLPPALAVRATG
ncbi:MAG: ABC transporter permease [Deltaproteobacteria bacterium]|nr:ABC transporter permease [Deltaproteobacteria bacterium]